MKGGRSGHSNSECHIARSLSVIGDAWSLLIVRDIFRGHHRYGEFIDNLGIARNILSARLKRLIQAGVLVIEPDPESARTHRYVLAPMGERLAPILYALWSWGEEYFAESAGGQPEPMVEKQSMMITPTGRWATEPQS